MPATVIDSVIRMSAIHEGKEGLLHILEAQPQKVTAGGKCVIDGPWKVSHKTFRASTQIYEDKGTICNGLTRDQAYAYLENWQGA